MAATPQMELVEPYDLETVAALDGATLHDAELQDFFPHDSPPTIPAEVFGAFERYVNEHVPDTNTKLGQFLHAPYDQRPPPKKAKSEYRDASKQYRDRKRSEFVEMQNRLAAAEQQLQEKHRQLQDALAANRTLTEERDKWKRAAETAKKSSQSPVPAQTTPLLDASPSGRSVSSHSVLGGPATAQAGPGYSREEELQMRFRHLEDLLEMPGATDEQIDESTKALSALFTRRNTITSDMAEEIMTPEYQLRNCYLNPTAEDVLEETEEQRRHELHIWGQVLHRAQYTQDQFERFVILRQQYKQALRGILRERIDINKGLRRIFMTKMGYLRTLNLYNVKSDANDVLEASKLLTRLSQSFTAFAQLRAWLLAGISNMSSIRQTAIISLQLRQPTIYTSVALAAMTQLMPPSAFQSP